MRIYTHIHAHKRTKTHRETNRNHSVKIRQIKRNFCYGVDFQQICFSFIYSEEEEKRREELAEVNGFVFSGVSATGFCGIIVYLKSLLLTIACHEVCKP